MATLLCQSVSECATECQTLILPIVTSFLGFPAGVGFLQELLISASIGLCGNKWSEWGCGGTENRLRSCSTKKNVWICVCPCCLLWMDQILHQLDNEYWDKPINHLPTVGLCPSTEFASTKGSRPRGKCLKCLGSMVII